MQGKKSFSVCFCLGFIFGFCLFFFPPVLFLSPAIAVARESGECDIQWVTLEPPSVTSDAGGR